jgi:hypothetical protein
MDKTESYAFLEKTFIATFLDELLPGIFHNFANPLNGIMGRSKLMQRRLGDFVKKLEDRYPGIEGEMGGDYKKLLSDVDAINRESEKFYDLFRVATGKFYAIGAHGVDKLNLSSLVEAEIGFADFYLDFKHNIKKEIRIDHEMPDISGITAFYSMVLWTLIRQGIKDIKNCDHETFYIATEHDDLWASVKIKPIRHALIKVWSKAKSNLNSTLDNPSSDGDDQRSLFYALKLVRQSSEEVEIMYDEEEEMLTLRFSYHHKRKEV